MRNYVITTDNTVDLPEELYKKYSLDKVNLSYVVNDVVYDGIEKSMTTKGFYNAMRDGAMPFTQQANPENCKTLFEQKIKEGYDEILHIAFSSGLSGTYNSARLAAIDIAEEYPDVKVTVIDSLCASLGEGLLVVEACRRKENGMSYEQLIKWIEANKLRLLHEVIADDLFHLYRGGRVSKVSAVVGTKLGVKPIIHLNSEGKLVSFSKQRHMKGAMRYLVNNLVEKRKTEDALTTIGICHSDCLDSAERLAELIREDVEVDEIIISDIGPTIGSHTGIGTIAVFYFGDTRNVK